MLSAVVETFTSTIHLLIAMVKYLRSSQSNGQLQSSRPNSDVVACARKALTLMQNARNQLIRGADGRNSNDIVGPVLTPEALVITLTERLVSAVHGNGRVDIIRIYEECLEKLVSQKTSILPPFLRVIQALQVKHEASRRLLQTINELQEEVAIVDTVLKQQMQVLGQLRSALDPSTFWTPSIARRLRYGYECRNIDRVMSFIRDQLRSCDELRERATNLSTQNVQLVETLQDKNSKAIFIFTMVTVFFLPLSFVAGFFGMNFDSISNTKYTVWHFWEIALPLTFGIVILCTIVAIKWEEVSVIFARLNRRMMSFLSRRGA